MITKDNQLICSYCGAIREKVEFMIGASPKHMGEWTMWQGTGRVSCPNCHQKGDEESRLSVKKITKSRY